MNPKENHVVFLFICLFLMWKKKKRAEAKKRQAAEIERQKKLLQVLTNVVEVQIPQVERKRKSLLIFLIFQKKKKKGC